MQTFGPPRQLTHGALLPPLTASSISADDRLILGFVLEYLAESEAAGILGNVSMHISGGYVRDLLLGCASQDLDLTLCLRSCEAQVTINTVVARMPDFAFRRPELGVEKVEIVTAMSDAARSKTVDAAAVRMLIRGDWILVDVMPTIGHETYDETDRIPQRDGRGTVEQDTLRRDLTIGSMLLEVTRPTTPRAQLLAEMAAARLAVGDGTAFSEQSLEQCVRAAAAATSLQFRLLDFHGGLADLEARLLRAPVPSDQTLAEVREQALRTELDHELATKLGVTGIAETGAAATVDELQTLWWIKTLRDDPLRLVRALRFSASLSFRVHPSFWSAVPFAVDALRSKVSGARKMTELRKLAAAGRPALLDFFDMAFAPLANFGEDVAFGDALFGGPDDDPDERLSIVDGFDPSRMRRAAAALPPEVRDDASIGALLGASLFSCELRPCDEGSNFVVCMPELSPLEADARSAAAADGAGWDGSEKNLGPSHWGLARSVSAIGLDNEAAAAALISSAESVRVCDGLCASTSMRQASTEPLQLIAALLTRRLYPPPPLGLHGLVAAAANLQAHLSEDTPGAAPASYAAVDFADAADANNVASLVHTWELLKLDPSMAQRKLEAGPDFVLAMMRTRCAGDTAAYFEAQVRLLRRAGPTVAGRAVAGLDGVPPHLRGHLISTIQVLCRLRGEAPLLETTEALIDYLEGTCGGLLSKLRKEWWEADGDEDASGQRKATLRALYTKKRFQEWAKFRS